LADVPAPGRVRRSGRAEPWCARVLWAVLAGCLIPAGGASAEEACPPVDARPQARGDGAGRFYLGRELAEVMGHQGADWLERPEREQEERPSELVRTLAPGPADVIADIGAGTGYFTFRLAPLVPRGRVIAVDIQPEMLTRLRDRQRQLGLRNVDTVLGTETDPGLPVNSVDLILMVDVYHEFARPCEMLRRMAAALRPGGRVALVEYRAEDERVPIRPSHRMTRRQAEREMSVAGLRLERSVPGLPWQHLLLFRKAP
jgi:ubiquinone/menaquinone biosynthesis C-methylase UbiE